MKGTFTVHGQRVRTSSNRRYVMFDFYGGECTGIYRRSDTLGTLTTLRTRQCKTAQRLPIVDTHTGEVL